jgi:hypothetical protein
MPEAIEKIETKTLERFSWIDASSLGGPGSLLPGFARMMHASIIDLRWPWVTPECINLKGKSSRRRFDLKT